MKKGNVFVDQVTKDGILVEGYDKSLSTSEIYDRIATYFPEVHKLLADQRVLVGNHKGHRFAIRCKNVTYLGNPHPHYKKRIQISEDLSEFHQLAVSINAKPILMGIYSFDNHTIFVDFKIDTYLKKKAHNSSAHIYVSDLAAATEDGYFQKTDYFGNTVTAIRPDMVTVYLDELFGIEEPEQSAETVIKESDGAENGHKISSDTTARFKKEIVPTITMFFQKEEKEWNGIACYQKMIGSDYRNKYQPEWVGFFLEYEFEKYLSENQLHNLITYAQDKKAGCIDLDLYFPTLEVYGDLKAHSEESRGIQGNDWDTIFSIINQHDEKGHIYYIVCEHSTEKDILHDYEVTKFWNTAQHKSNLMSYSARMKHHVTLKKVYLLDINYDNRQYLTTFRQEINSNGKPRAPKIMIEQDNLSHFVIEELSL